MSILNRLTNNEIIESYNQLGPMLGSSSYMFLYIDTTKYSDNYGREKYNDMISRDEKRPDT